MQLTEDQISQWHQLKAQFDADAHCTANYAQVCAERKVIRPQIAELLNSFLNNEMSIEDLRSIWHVKTRTVWNRFGLKGMSSAMFLNILVKHLPDQKQTTDELKRIVRVPTNETEARTRMAAFEAFLEGEIKADHVARRFLQTARIPFFVSAFWHMQNTELWPMFYVSAREAFRRHGLYVPKNNIAVDYFGFRDVYRTLMSTLNVSAWDVEQLCWFDQEKIKANQPSVVSPDPNEEEAEDDTINNSVTGTSPSTHTQAQWFLASIGKTLKCKVWIASNDHNKTWNDQRLGDMSIPSLPPLGIGATAEKIIRLIDVLWLKGTNQVVAAFEIEHSTSIYSGLLRMADLTALSPNISFPLYIVAPKQRLDSVRLHLSRPSLQELELHFRCGFFSIEALAENAENIKKWAKQPDAIDKLAEYVEPADEEEV